MSYSPCRTTLSRQLYLYQVAFKLNRDPVKNVKVGSNLEVTMIMIVKKSVFKFNLILIAGNINLAYTNTLNIIRYFVKYSVGMTNPIPGDVPNRTNSICYSVYRREQVRCANTHWIWAQRKVYDSLNINNVSLFAFEFGWRLWVTVNTVTATTSRFQFFLHLR